MILDHYGKPMAANAAPLGEVMRLRGEIRQLRAKYDATVGGDALTNHWANSDNLGPNAANSFSVRKTLRKHSRYEVIENNPYVKGSVLTIANDFIGSGPKLSITDPRVSRDAKLFIQRSYLRWAKQTAYRQKLWQLRLAKIVDGEGWKIAFFDPTLRHPVKLNYQVVEADRVSSLGVFSAPATSPNEVDGVRVDSHSRPVEYHLMDEDPSGFFPSMKGEWIPAPFVTQWFRKDRNWLRGIPELTPSLPLCALLRRYTRAVVLAAESAADFAVLLETEGPAAANVPGFGTQDVDAWSSFPIQQGMMTALPWQTKASQMKAEQPVQTYDVFTHTLLTEIVRPLAIPFNLAVGTSKDSNMASAVVDTHIYKQAQHQERIHCQEEVLDPDFDLWWEEFIRSPEVRDEPEMFAMVMENPSLTTEPPAHTYRWDNVGLSHTDPLKVAKAREVNRLGRVRTERDIQEEDFNRDVEEWRAEVEDDLEWEERVGLVSSVDDAQPIPDDGEDDGDEEA